MFLGGAAGGAALMQVITQHGAPGYLAGLGIALIFTYFYPRQLEKRIEQESARRSVQMLNFYTTINRFAHDEEVRRVLTLTTLFPSDVVLSVVNITEDDYA